jgi:glycosyltransferase involved in cell wall biosynthesis
MPASGLLRERWSKSRPDVVHVATEGPLGYSALKVAGAMGIPVSSSFHTNFHQYGGHYGMSFVRDFAVRYLRWFHNRAACTLVPTDDMAVGLAKLGFERLAVLSRGVDARLFSPMKRSETLRKAWGVSAEEPVILYVGRIAAEKNLGLTIEAYQAMRVIYPRTRFVLVGDGPLRADLELKYPEFIFAGTLRGEELSAHYASADVFLFASVTETFGNVVTEALASGLVVAGYDYAALRQHVRNGSNGFGAKFDDKQAFVDMAQDVMRKRATWPSVRAAARSTAQAISWDAVVAQFEAKFVSIAKAH